VTAGLDQDDGALVLHVIPTPRGRGAQIGARLLADRLDEPGVVRHRLLSLFHGKEELEIDLYLGEPGGSHVSEGFKPRAALHFRKELARLNPALVVAHGGEPMKYAVPALVGTGRPLVYCVIGTFAGKPTPLREGVWRRLTARANLVVAVGNEVYDECTGRFRLPSQRVVTIPYGRDPFEFRPRAGPAPGGDPTLLFCGALTPQKQPNRFVEVVRHLRSEGRAFRALIVGDGPLAPTMANVAPAHGIELLGPRSDIPELFRRSDVFVFPSRPNGEGLPGVLIEAGMSGLPTVSTRAPGASTVICDGQTGVILDDSVPAMASAIGRLLDDTQGRITMGAAARKRCESNFTLDLMIQRWRDVLQPLLTAPESSRN
jgi:glycosyltransferase involved in cell wall biosynthesis